MRDKKAELFTLAESLIVREQGRYIDTMKLERSLDKAHAWVVKRWWAQMFAVFIRLTLAVGFIPPSIPKILHKPFTALPDSNPVGHYFNALYQTGFYYEFIGWAQITAAILLLIPRTAHIGALMFLPIIVNIAVLTTSVGFVGTWFLTILMCLAAAYLACWEYDRLKPILFYNRVDQPRRFRFQFLSIPAFFAAGGALMGVLWWMLRLGNLPNYLTIGAGLAAFGFVFGLLFALHYRYMPTGDLADDAAVLR